MTSHPEPPSPQIRPSGASMWPLLIAVVGFGSYFVWRDLDDRRIARGDLTPWERMEIVRRQNAEIELNKQVDKILGIPR